MSVVKFLQFINEESMLLKEASGAVANSQGVAFEAALTRDLHHKGKFAEQHENDDGMNAEEAHRHHMNNLSHDLQMKIAAGSKAAAKAIRDHLHENGDRKSVV